jgi:hypothetical protein
MIDAGALDQHIVVQALREDDETGDLTWENAYKTWAKAEADSRSNLFSSIGIGARGVTFTMRFHRQLTLGHSFLWRGQFCFLTSITDAADAGFVTVKAALCQPQTCQKDMDREPAGPRFPGILTEKYIGHEQTDLHSEVTGTFVLVTPKAMTLAPGSWVTVGGNYYRVLVPHELDQWKNEFEVRRKEDC